MFIIYDRFAIDHSRLEPRDDRPTDMLVRPGQTFNGTQRKLLNLIEEFDPGSD